MQSLGWMLLMVGLVIAAAGALWLLVPGTWLGRLPGDVAVERGNFRFYFPLATCILLSVVLSGIIWLVRYFSR